MEFLLILLLFLASVAASKHNLYPRIPRESSPEAARITNGEIAAEGQFPYQAALIVKPKVGNSTRFCGGTLISSRDVLTAAHCCQGGYKIDVFLGSLDINNETEPSRVTMTVLRRYVKIHEDYDSAAKKVLNDICIVRLPREVEFSQRIQIAQLPEDDTNDFVNKSVIASGWGRDSDQLQTISPVLKFVKSRVIKNRICNLFHFGGVKETHLCIDGAHGVSTCNGDSGGPLILENIEGNSTTLVGITSFGSIFGCEAGWPSAFTRVSKYLEWIKANMSS